MKKKTYYYENRTFEVKVRTVAHGCMLAIFINEVIRPNRKFFGRTRQFYRDYVITDKYPSIKEAVESVLTEGLLIEVHRKQVNEKWKEWNEE